jgi:glucose/arabinose dehydrogenase
VTLPFRSGLAVLVTVAGFLVAAGAAQASTYIDSNFSDRTIADSFGSPGTGDIVAVAWAPDGRMFVADRAGVVFVHNPGDPPGTNQLVLNISGHVNNGSGTDHGLLGIATDKNFASNGFLYLLYTYDNADDPDGPDSTNPKVSVLTRVTVNPDDSVVGGTNSPTETTILGSKQDPLNDSTNGDCGPAANDNNCIPSEGTSHSIGTVRVAPDGTLFVGTGDGNDFLRTDPLTRFDDNPLTFRGKIMHIQPNGQGVPGHPFCPSDTNLDDVCTKIFAGGFRNPFRFTLMPGGGLAIGDVGQDHFEEVDLTSGGQNFGWPCYEGNHVNNFTNNDGNKYSDQSFCTTMYNAGTATPAAFEISHNNDVCDASIPSGETVVGGPVYEGDQYPAGYRGQLFFGDVGGGPNDPSCGWLGRASISGNSLTNYQAFSTDWNSVGVDIESAPDGNLAYVALGDSAVREIVYGPGNHAPIAAPTVSPTSGNAPLTVNFTAHASDPDGDPITYDWDFGDGSAHSTSVNPTHVYTSKGNWVAKLTVSDNRGMSGSGSVPVPVGLGGGGSGPPVKITKLRLSVNISALLRRGQLSGSFVSRNSVKTLDVALWRGKPGAAASCRWWSRRSHKLRGGACSQPHWMKATLHRKGSRYTWTLKLGGKPPRGKYTLVFQAIPRSTKLAPSRRIHKTLRVR